MRRLHTSTVLGALLAIVFLAGGCRPAEPGTSTLPQATLALHEDVTRAAQAVYDHCLATVSRGSTARRPPAEAALNRLFALYATTPSSPVPDRGRAHVRSALDRAERQLSECDPRLALSLRHRLGQLTVR